MEPTLEIAPGMHELTYDELRQIRGGDGGKRLLWHILERAVDCIIDDWDNLTQCFKDGMAEAKN